MATLINRIQRAMLGSAGPEKVRVLLIELAIPAGGSGENALRAARRGFLRPISHEAILRNALDSLGLTGGGTGARPLTRIRSALLHNLVDSEATLRDGLNDLLGADDLVTGSGEPPTDIFLSASTVAEDAELGAVVGVLSAIDPELDDVTFTLVDDAGGLFGIDGTNLIVTGVLDYETAEEEGGAPEWVPENAVIHIDLVGGSPQGRAWVEGTGEVDVDTLLGTDANTENGWTVTEYDPTKLQAQGLLQGSGKIPALIGAARTAVIGGATIRVKIFSDERAENPIILTSADGNYSIWVQRDDPNELSMYSFDALSEQIEGVVNDNAVNCFAVTVTQTRLEAAANESDPLTATLTEDDRPVDALVAAIVDAGAQNHLQSITIYETFPDTTGLPVLSETGVTNTAPHDLVCESTGTTEVPVLVGGDAGEVVDNFIATDDEGNPYVITITVGEADFIIEEDIAGSVYQLKTARVLDPDTYSVTLRATDPGGLYVEQEFTIAVTA